MKKLTLLLSALLIAGVTFACDGDKGKKACCKKGEAKKECCKKGGKEASKEKAATNTKKA
ncbi:hypothetical protein [Polluticoccus soli]|uniref:hypothetical protein n=1 Tax=Polluticoccus soli TaxID=3034150 RepID=UPI0023E0E0C2|nr:hypothetical protein [Flavipsychrobacter sp. JY13-12]